METDASLQAYLRARLLESPQWAELHQAAARRSAPAPTHTPLEILQQPWVWRESARLVAGRMDELSDLIEDKTHIYLNGAGSSYYVGKCAESLLQNRLGRPVVAVPSTDLILNPKAFLNGKKALLISFSRSGRSPESFEVARRVSEQFPDYHQLLITCDDTGTLSEKFTATPNGTVVGLHPACCDRGLAMTSSFTSMIVATQALGFLGDPDGYLEHVDRLAAQARELLCRAVGATAPADLEGIRRACLLGDGALNGPALEGALKMLEMTDGQIPTISESFLGVRHGPLSFVDSRTLLIYFVSSHLTWRKYERDLMQEMQDKELGALAIGVGCHLSEFDGLFRQTIDLSCGSADELPDDLRPPLDVLVPQVLALRLCLSLGLNPDNPSRRGAINRVVQGVTIHEA